jgi:hypothetical protein
MDLPVLLDAPMDSFGITLLLNVSAQLDKIGTEMLVLLVMEDKFGMPSPTNVFVLQIPIGMDLCAFLAQLVLFGTYKPYLALAHLDHNGTD